MGLFSIFRKNPEVQISKAQKLVAGGEFARARQLLEGMEQEAAQTTLKEALGGLRELNLQEALALANAGEFDRAEEHLELAEQFGSTVDDSLKEARRVVRTKRSSAPVKAKRAPVGGGDPFGMGGGGGVPAPPPEGFEEDGPVAEPIGNRESNSIWDLPPDDPRLAVAMAMESYPEEIRERLLNLGTEFIGAVTLIDKHTIVKIMMVFGIVSALEKLNKSLPSCLLDFLHRALVKETELESFLIIVLNGPWPTSPQFVWVVLQFPYIQRLSPIK